MMKAIQAFVDVIDDDEAPAAAKVSAANSILDRGYGKAVQPVDGDGEGGSIKVVTRIELIGISPE